jgi:ABC-type sugar transport system ATPase subunit
MAPVARCDRGLTYHREMSLPIAATALSCQDVRKSFGASRALRGVDVAVSVGEAVAVLGENGAGKSTLVRIIGGEIAPDHGAVVIGGTALAEHTPSAATALGVAVIHQELSYVGPMSVAENIMLGRLPTLGTRGVRRLLLDRRRMHQAAAAALSLVGAHIDPQRRMSALSIGDRQLVEVARAFASGASLILMDEPTAALGAYEVTRLFEAIAVLKAQHVGVLYISHRLDEIARVADRIVVLRDGRKVAEHDVGTVSRKQLVTEIVGKELVTVMGTAEPPAPVAAAARPRLELRGIEVSGRIRGVDLSVARGEIVGLYGLFGSGLEVLGPAIFGSIRAGGEVLVDDQRLRRRDPARCVKAGLAMVPADRRADGLLPIMSLAANITIARHAARGSAHLIAGRRDRLTAQESVRRIDIRPADPDVPVRKLSGGNQQKSIFARWLLTTPKAFVLDEPTRGIDVGARAQMYQLIRGLAADGAAVLVISSDLQELMTLSATIGVVSRGALVATFPAAGATEQEIIDLAIGGTAA